MNPTKKIPELIQGYWKTKSYMNQYTKGLKAAVTPYGLSALETEIVLSLSNHPASDSVTKLCLEINKTKGVVSEACEHLLRMDYISAKADAKDRRIIHYQLLPASRPFVAAIARYLDAMETTIPNFDQEIDSFFQKKLADKLSSAYLAIIKVNLRTGTVYLLKQNESFAKILLPELAADYPSLLSHWENLLHPDDKFEFMEIFSSPVTGSRLAARFQVNAEYHWLTLQLADYDGFDSIITLRNVDAEMDAFSSKIAGLRLPTE